MDDASLVAHQLGRAPRGRWRVAWRCEYGHPGVIVTAPLLEDGTPFPTLCYLTCPHLVERVAALESVGEVERWRRRLATDPVLAARLRAADVAYRAARTAEAGGEDPTPDVGIAGQRDPLAVKCLHAHVASALAGIDDPIGVAVLRDVGYSCDDGRCGSLDDDEERDARRECTT